jgi:5-methylcytosine-specific restriction endonuclease McrA
MQARRAQKLGLFVERVKFEDVWVKCEGICFHCHGIINSRKELSWDHFTPLAKGGVHSLDNVVGCHLHCNLKKGAKIVQQPDPTPNN